MEPSLLVFYQIDLLALLLPFLDLLLYLPKPLPVALHPFVFLALNVTLFLKEFLVLPLVFPHPLLLLLLEVCLDSLCGQLLPNKLVDDLFDLVLLDGLPYLLRLGEVSVQLFHLLLKLDFLFLD